MTRLECFSCHRCIPSSSSSSPSRSFVCCHRCHRHSLQRLDSSLRAALCRSREHEQQLRIVSRQAQFLSSWDADTLTASLSDFTIRARDGPDLPAHRALLAGKSPVFKAMLTSPMKEARTGVLTIDDFSHEVLSAFVQFLYTAKISPEILSKHATALFCAAQKYDIKLLKSVCEEFLVKNVSKENAITLLELARKYDSENVKDAVLRAAYMDVDKVCTFGDYNAYFEKDPKLLVELYEGLVRRITHKRSRFSNLDEGEAVSSSRARIAVATNHGSHAEDVASSSPEDQIF